MNFNLTLILILSIIKLERNKNMINEKIYTQFKEYLNYLLVNSTVESPLWNKEVLIGLKKTRMDLYRWMYDGSAYCLLQNNQQ